MRKFRKFNHMGNGEKKAVIQVIKSGVLSGFYGNWGEYFEGGPRVRAFEKDCEEYFQIEHAITFNSLASGLSAAIGAIGIGPGDEVILPPWTMSATATAILHWGGIPIFCDIDQKTYCIDPRLVEKLINEKTKAIIAVDIFGQSADIETLAQVAKKYNLLIISDSAQAIGAKRNGYFAGTHVDIGGISLNYHKHIHTGEGAVMFTRNADLALRLKLIRNHAESVIADIPYPVSLVNMIGHNYRMTEVQAAIGSIQLQKLPKILRRREEEASRLREVLGKFSEIELPLVDDGNTHVYYLFAMQLNEEILPFNKLDFVEAITKQGVPGLSTQYLNLHMLPIFQQKIAMGGSGFPWTYEKSREDISYAKGICPVAEMLQEKNFFSFYMNDFMLTKKDISFIGKSFERTFVTLKRTL
jgi:perosamine synthetase